MQYRLISTKGTEAIEGTREDAVAAAIAMEERLQPAFGVTVEADGVTVAEIRDGKEDADEDAVLCVHCGHEGTIAATEEWYDCPHCGGRCLAE